MSNYQRWAIIKTGSHIKLGLVKIVGNYNYWDGGPSYFTGEVEIVKEKIIDVSLSNSEKEIDDLRLEMYADLYDYEPELNPVCSEGWISPDGKFYTCLYAEHRSSAFILSYKYYRVPDGEILLERKGWLKVYNDGNIASGDYIKNCTQKQLDTMSWLLNIDETEIVWIDNMKNNLKTFTIKEIKGI